LAAAKVTNKKNSLPAGQSKQGNLSEYMGTGDLFDQFNDFSGLSTIEDADRHKYINLLGLYDLIPKKVLTQSKTDSVVTRVLKNRSHNITIEIKPAVFAGNKLVYPGVREDRVESALAYLACHGRSEIDSDTDSIKVFFTLRKVQRVIKKVLKREYSVVQIREALTILNESQLNITPNNKDASLAIKSTRLSALVIHTRKEFVSLHEAGDETTCIAVFHPLFALDIQQGRYNLHDLEWQGSLKNDLAETLYKQLSAHWRQASVEENYSFSASRFLESTSLGLSTTNTGRNWANVRKALIELHDKDFITKPNEDIRYLYKDGSITRKIEDVIFDFYASTKLQEMMIKSNVHKRLSKKKIKESSANRLAIDAV